MIQPPAFLPQQQPATDRNRMHVSFSIGPMAVRVEPWRCPILSSPKLLPPPPIDR